MVVFLTLTAYVGAIIIAIRRKDNWFRNILFIQGVVSIALIGSFLVNWHSDVIIFGASFFGLLFTFAGLIILKLGYINA